MHRSAHVIVFSVVNGIRCLILGLTPKGELSSFGGTRESGELPLNTLIREFKEETLECLTDPSTLVSSLEGPVIRDRCHWNYRADLILDFETCKYCFQQRLKDPTLTASQREHLNLIAVPVANLTELSKPVKALDNNYYYLRPAMITALRYWLSQ